MNEALQGNLPRSGRRVKPLQKVKMNTEQELAFR
jgi:hypothetical protein